MTINTSVIRRQIENKAPEFKRYIDQVLQKTGMNVFISYYADRTDVYVFSGVIRDFLLGNIGIDKNRDYDFVISGMRHFAEPLILREELLYNRNKFGGLKINKDDYVFDIWGLEDTWGLVRKNVKHPDAKALAKSAFFNFSAIVFDYNSSSFIVSKEFCNFIISKKMDVVYKVNPHVESCIVSSFYYADQYNLKIGDELKKWIIKYYSKRVDYKPAQVKRFGHVIYDNDQIGNLVEMLVDM